MRLRKRTSVLASNGASSRKPGSPIKYCRYGFSAICSTSSRSENWNLVWMIRAPNAIRRGLATLPVSLGNSLAYFTSNSSHGIRSASLTQRLSGFMWSPIGWLKSRNECCNLSIGLYIVLAPLYLKSVRKLQEKRFVFVKILAIIIPENGAKVSKIKCLQLNQQTLINSLLLYHHSRKMTTKNDRFWLKINISGVMQYCHSEARVNYRGSSQTYIPKLSITDHFCW